MNDWKFLEHEPDYDVKQGNNIDIGLMKEAAKKMIDSTDGKRAVERMYKSIQAIYVNS